jgi:undecaprenyl-diphosphatase
MVIVHWLDLAIFALVEGVMDILPLDASAHRLVLARLAGWHAGPMALALHLGALLALIFYLWRDVGLIASGLWKLRKTRIEAGTRLLAKMLLAAAPLLLAQSGVIGLAPLSLNDFLVVGIITVILALIMLFADRLSLTVKRIEHIGVGTSLAVGLAQLLSLIPGVGRVAVGLTMARLFGMERRDAFRFTLLVTIPILIGTLIGDVIRNGRQAHAVDMPDLIAGGLAFLFVLIALPVAFSLIKRSGLLVFALYRLLFGLALIGLGLL